MLAREWELWLGVGGHVVFHGMRSRGTKSGNWVAGSIRTGSHASPRVEGGKDASDRYGSRTKPINLAASGEARLAARGGTEHPLNRTKSTAVCVRSPPEIRRTTLHLLDSEPRGSRCDARALMSDRSRSELEINERHGLGRRHL